jgi:hypothetical protein
VAQGVSPDFKPQYQKKKKKKKNQVLEELQQNLCNFNQEGK